MIRLTLEGSAFLWEQDSFKRSPPSRWEIPQSFQDQLIETHLTRDEILNHSEDISLPVLVWDDHVLEGGLRVCVALSQGEIEVWAVILDNIPSPDDVVDALDPCPFFTAREIIDILNSK